MHAQRLSPDDRDQARRLFALMADVFGEGPAALSDAYLERLLLSDGFWVIAAFVRGDLVGGLTAHTLAMTRKESSELFIYDIAVLPSHQRQGVGRLLVTTLLDAAARLGIRDVFVPADNEDTHALDFYRALGAAASAVTFFTFSR
jgi:aminoglycoside 3-N-acetyltransferase I